MNIAVNGAKLSKVNGDYYVRIIKAIQTLGFKPIFERSLRDELYRRNLITSDIESFQSSSDLKSGIDLALSVGGDGTFISTVSYVRDSGVPIAGINLGRLGFLATISPEEIEERLDLVKSGSFLIQERHLLKVDTPSELFGTDNYAVNELTIGKRDTASMITVHAHLNGNFLNSYWADGLIVSTPTGSTAYNLSFGGPIVTPSCQVHILTPMAPHNLNVRPMVVPDDLPIKLSVEGRAKNFLISIDSNYRLIPQDEEVTITKSTFAIKSVKFEDTRFVSTLRQKMLWGNDKRNK